MRKTPYKPATDDHRLLSAWLDNQPDWLPFGESGHATWNHWTGTLANNLPPGTTLAVAQLDGSQNKPGDWAYELRGPVMGDDHSFLTHSEVLPRENRLHMGRAFVNPNARRQGTGGSIFAGQMAAMTEAGGDVATFKANDMGIKEWALYRPTLDWGEDIMSDFAVELDGNVRRACRAKLIDRDTRDEIRGQIQTNDPELLIYLMDHPDLQETRGRYTLAQRLLGTASYAGIIDLNGEDIHRVFDEIDLRAEEGRQPFVVWRPRPLQRGQRYRHYG